MKAIAALLLLLFTVAPAFAQTPPPAGTWAQIPNTRTWDVMEQATFYQGHNAYNPVRLLAYSGADLVQIGGVWGFVITGGGQAATPDNSTIFVPFDGSGPRQLQGPYTSPDNVYLYDSPFDIYKPSGVWTDARKSTHTYSSLLAIQKNGLPFLFLTGGSTYTGTGKGTATTRIFDLRQTRAQAMARLDLGWQKTATAPAASIASSSGWDPVQRRVVHRGARFVGAYYPDEDRWETWPVFPAATFCCDYSASVSMDLAGRKMYVLGDRIAEQYDLDTKQYVNLAGQPWAVRFSYPMAGPGVAWHDRTAQIIAFMGEDGNSLDVLNPQAQTRTPILMGGGPVSAPEQSGTYGRFRVIPGTDMVVLLNSVMENVWIGTLPFAGGPPPPPAGLVTLNAPTVLSNLTGMSTTSGYYSLNMTATTTPKTFAAGTVAAAYRYRILEIATGYINDDVRPYNSGVPPPSVWPVLRGGQYDISVVLQNAAGQALIDTSGAVASVGSLRITVPTQLASVTLSAPTAMTYTMGQSTVAGYGSMTFSATTTAKIFAAGATAASYRYRIVEIATSYVNDDLAPYNAGAPRASVWPRLRPGDYDLVVALVNTAGQVLTDTSGVLASSGPVRITVATTGGGCIPPPDRNAPGWTEQTFLEAWVKWEYTPGGC